MEYVNSLPALRKEFRQKAQPEWDSGVTSKMVAASYEYVDALQGILVKLASYYPPGTFGGDDPHKFFSELILLVMLGIGRTLNLTALAQAEQSLM